MAATSRSSGTDDEDTERVRRSKAKKVRTGRPVHLPLHLTEKILSCISLLESARVATVCKSWAATVSARLAIPHLFVYTPRDVVDSDRRGLIVSVALDGTIGAAARLPSATSRAHVRLEETRGRQCIGATPSGHLAFSSWWSLSLVLVNPVTGGESQTIDVRQQQRRVVLSGGGRDDSFVDSANNNYPAKNQIDSSMSVANCNGCFHMLRKNGGVYKIDATAPSPLLIETVPAVEGLIDDDDQFFIPPATYRCNGHLLESDGEILFVRRLLVSKEVALPCNHRKFESVNVGFEVYRLDGKDQRWDKVEKLDGHRALFGFAPL
ncbi:hypothetical protein QOZ80_2AG0108780 [Eleusine coracana subsp. coracana]|nr:hypothetical protein QOZ80_2AG0108780 [Eleusine coracana subsp. coracana]